MNKIQKTLHRDYSCTVHYVYQKDGAETEYFVYVYYVEIIQKSKFEPPTIRFLVDWDADNKYLKILEILESKLPIVFNRVPCNPEHLDFLKQMIEKYNDFYLKLEFRLSDQTFILPAYFTPKLDYKIQVY